MLYSSECWALRQEDKKCLVRSEIARAVKVVQHQERTTCQHKFPPKSIETEKSGFSAKV